MIRRMFIGGAALFGLMLVAGLATVDAGVKRFPSVGMKRQAFQRANRPNYYTPYGSPFYLADPLYYGTAGTLDGTVYRPQTQPVDPGVYSSGFAMPQPGFQWNLYP